MKTMPCKNCIILAICKGKYNKSLQIYEPATLYSVSRAKAVNKLSKDCSLIIKWIRTSRYSSSGSHYKFNHYAEIHRLMSDQLQS